MDSNEDLEPTIEEYEAVNRGERAKQILEDPLVVGALSAIEKAVYDAFQNTQLGATKELEHLHRMHRAVHMFRQALTSHIMDGNIALNTIEAKETSKSFWQRTKEKIHGSR